MTETTETTKQTEPTKIPDPASRVIDYIRHDMPGAEFSTDLFILGGCMVDITWRERWVVVEWQPARPNHFGVSLNTDDTLPFTGPDEVIEGELETARRVAALLRAQ